MKNTKFWEIVVITLLLPIHVWSQTAVEVEGIVLSEDEQDLPLVGANIFWLGTTMGVTSEIDGTFRIAPIENSSQLVVSYIGYQNDTVSVSSGVPLVIKLSAGNTLDEVEVVHRKKATEFSFLDPIKVEQINEKELLKAACCNLSESFETSPSVDVAFTDAITGTRQIQMLGLAGPYIQITRESMPYIRGLSSLYGLTAVPGTWVSGMQLNKGTGAVANGFESIAGQINIEMRKPTGDDKMYLNFYADEGARFEGNLNLSQEIDDQWATALLLHGKFNHRSMDRNDDGFLDNPLSDHFIALNRWQYRGNNGMRFQFGIAGTYINDVGGQTSFEPERDALSDRHWGMKLNLNRLEGWVKLGKVYEALPWRSWAIQLSGSKHEQDSYFGQRDYQASQNSLYANILYQSIIGNTNHQVLMGLSMQYDDFDETFQDASFDRSESVPGGFFEYTYGGHEKFSLVAGLRGDYHNAYGFFATPRLHLRYAFNDQVVWRASLGRGQRTANILAENNGLMAANRRFNINSETTGNPYGLDPEIAWNAGTNVVYTFQSHQRPGSISVDFYRTEFQNQIVIDLDQNAQEVNFYNLDGQSFSNSFQLQLDYEVATRLDARLAYRWYDVKTTYNGDLLDKPLISKQRLFFNLGYATGNDWSFDYTINWQGPKRIPFTGSNPKEYQLADSSPGFVVMNAQISKRWREKFEVYLGGENLLNYRQKNPILASDDPFGPYFDSSLTWGPIFGRNIYMGMRYRI
ncbi:MAG: TonB-dependent receptor [Saprospiraceae bacterium]|nr:TonB-dependent receptor [Saprospiraceae bacterium]